MINRIIEHNTLVHRNCKAVKVADPFTEFQHKQPTKFFFFCIGTILFLLITGCKKLVDVEAPNTQITSDNVYNNDATAVAVLNGLYSKISNAGSYPGSASISQISLWAGLSADEFALWSGTAGTALNLYYQNGLRTSIDEVGSEFWYNTYPLIYSCNAAIEGLNRSASISPAVKRQLLGEAKFVRAYFYFYMVNLFGDVPLVLTTDYSVNSLIKRSSKEAVYGQVLSDLNEAKNLLTDGYVKSDMVTLYSAASAQRIRPCKAASSAMLARVYLYTTDWAKAESEATAVISNTILYDIVPLNQVFNKNNKEAIWQIQPVTTGTTNTFEGVFYNLTNAPTGVNSSHPVYLSQSLLNSFEAGDNRKLNGNWVDSFTDASGTYYYPYKYKEGNIDAPVTEYAMYLRVAEVYLIRAEARAHLNNLPGAIADLDVIRNRAGLSLIANTNPGISQTDLINAILHERQVELFSESGLRWLDLKRTETIDAVMSTATSLKGGTWQSYQQLYPIPGSEMLKNPNMTQNVGY